ncbi:putative membrane protein [Ehrlichia japonica]|uniref:Putative membrane protein n=1 Tax=Ehrlichia japonica TaxID=391036 RepID=X5H3W4_9RICK|nr:putative membrane protein [Ehrlichia japonica]
MHNNGAIKKIDNLHTDNPYFLITKSTLLSCVLSVCLFFILT